MDPATAWSIGSGIGKVVGGLFGRRSAAKQARRQREQEISDFKNKGKWIRQSAERGGFNPLTMLNATGGNLGRVSSGVPPLASTSFLLDGIQDLSDGFTGRAAIEAAQAREDLRLTRVQADRIEAGEAGRIAGRYNSNVLNPKPRVGAGSPAPGSVGPSTRLEKATQDQRDSQRDISTPHGVWEVSERGDMTENVEQEYGEIAAEIYGAGKLAYDLGKNGRNWLDKWTEGGFTQTFPQRNKPQHVVIPSIGPKDVTVRFGPSN